MATQYKLEVTTGDMKNAGTMDHIYVTLFGTEGQSERTDLDNFGFDFVTGTTRTYTVKTDSCLGKLLLVKVEKDPFLCFAADEWYCSKIVVTTPDGDVILFPCYRWVSRGELVELRGGRAVKVFEEDHDLLIDQRKRELTIKQSLYQWKVADEKLPHHMYFEDLSALPAELRFSMSKREEIARFQKEIAVEVVYKGLHGSTEQWESFEDMKEIFRSKKTPLSEYVTEHWKEDDFFGFQFLNGINPTVIERCTELPPNFPVTEAMVKPFLEKGSSLKNEMKKGNIFLLDQKIMDGIPSRVLDGDSLSPMTASLCLFYVNPEKKLMPIAIQLHQQPSKQNPIFLPSDTEMDWLLAKIFVNSTDLMEHETVHHLMNTHFLAEVFMVAAIRNFPVIHPLYKLLIPHFRYTFQINSLARKLLLGSNGTLAESSLGLEGVNELMRRAHSETTYSSLCLPENIAARGLQSIPNFYYRDDGLKLWDIINSFVKKIVEYYYPSDSDVQKDTELQGWINEIFKRGFMENKLSGIPASFDAVGEVIKFITMLIFTVTAQHAAVNNGQFDYHYWTPNGALLLHKPPPTTKGQSSLNTIFETLPKIGEAVKFAGALWTLSSDYTDEIHLGGYPDERFDEPAPKKMIKEFQAELSKLSEAIKKRNSGLEVPYTFLDPDQIENSVTI